MSLFLIWHFALSSFVAIVMAITFGSLSPLTSAIALLIGAIGSYFISRADAVSKTLFIDPKNRSTETLWLERVAVIFVVYVCYRHFLYLFYEVGSDIRTLNVNNYGDLPLHINYIRMIANGSEFPWINPSFAADHLRYPMGIDLYNALWDAIGVRLPAHLFAVGLIGCALIIRFVRILASWWGVVGLFLSGGFAGWVHFSGTPAELQSLLAWKNIFLSVIVTQRGFLFALPAGLYLILRARRHESLSWTFGLLWGILAFFHLHSFVIVSLILGGEAGLRRDVKKFYRSLAIAVPLGSAFVLYSTQGLQNSSFLRWQWGWMNEGNLLWFLNFNFGPYLYLAIGSLIYFAIVGFHPKFKKPEYKQINFHLWLYFLLFLLFF